MVIVKANPKLGRATTVSDFSYLRSSYLLDYMMATANHTIFEKNRVFRFHVIACHLKQVITECMISMFKNRQLLLSTHTIVYHM